MASTRTYANVFAISNLIVSLSLTVTTLWMIIKTFGTPPLSSVITWFLSDFNFFFHFDSSWLPTVTMTVLFRGWVSSFARLCVITEQRGYCSLLKWWRAALKPTIIRLRVSWSFICDTKLLALQTCASACVTFTSSLCWDFFPLIVFCEPCVKTSRSCISKVHYQKDYER